MLYLWLAAFFTQEGGGMCDDLQADLVFLNQAYQSIRQVLANLPGLAAAYADLAVLTLCLRPDRRLPGIEVRVERVARHASTAVLA